MTLRSTPKAFVSAVAMLAAASVLAACGLGNSTQRPKTGEEQYHEAIAEQNAGLFRACDRISDQVIADAGLDPRTKADGIAGVKQIGWELCGWTGDWFYITVLSTSHSWEDVKTNPSNIDFHVVDLPGRDAVAFRHESDKKNEICDVAFPSSEGVLTVRSSTKAAMKPEMPPCEHALEYAKILDSHLPR
ncbi:MAG: DUF3558 family protein [Rhodococcus sp.]|nr:DUF3558 family protein [Rhodococcus sp. (in: high G+C Gram-positive bacteria)]